MRAPILVVNPVGGLANRMRAVAAAVSLAHDVMLPNDSDIKPYGGLKLIWLRNWELNARFEDIFTPLSDDMPHIDYPSALKYELMYSVPRKRNLYVTSMTLRRFGLVMIGGTPRFADMTASDSLMANVSRYLRDGRNCYIQAGTPFHDFTPDLYRALFRPSAKVRALVNEHLEQLGSNPTGVHIRRTDNIISRKHSPDELFVDKIKQIISTDDSARIYLATDDQSTKIRFREIFGSHIVFSRSAADRDSVGGIIEAAAELYTLAACDRIYGSWYSSFSEAAAMLGGKPLEQLRV